MKPIEIVEMIRNESPGLLVATPDSRAAAIVRQALSHIARQVAAIDEGVVKVAGLGQFVIRQVAPAEPGQGRMKRVFFREAAVEPESEAIPPPPAKPKKPSTDKEGGKKKSRGAKPKKPAPRTQAGLF